jgi:hypothetical protein
MGNDLQLIEILRYHRHLHRLGRALDLEVTARIWIRRFARLWREHRVERGEVYRLDFRVQQATDDGSYEVRHANG